MEIYLQFYINYQQDDWVKWLDQAEFIQNNRYHAGIQQTPYYLIHGFHPWNRAEEAKTSGQNPGAMEWKEQWEKARESARQALEKAAESMK